MIDRSTEIINRICALNSEIHILAIELKVRMKLSAEHLEYVQGHSIAELASWQRQNRAGGQAETAKPKGEIK